MGHEEQHWSGAKERGLPDAAALYAGLAHKSPPDELELGPLPGSPGPAADLLQQDGRSRLEAANALVSVSVCTQACTCTITKYRSLQLWLGYRRYSAVRRA